MISDGRMDMKRYMIIIAAVMTFLLSGTAQAQETDMPKYELRLGWSGYPTMDYENFTVWPRYVYVNTPIKDMFSNYDGDTYMTGNIMAAMDIRLKKWFTFSIGVAANGVWKDVHDVVSGNKSGRVNGCIFTVLPQAKFTWVNREMVRLYSSLGLGVTAGEFDGVSDCYLAGQAVLLGISVGRRLVGFAELGSGSMYMGGMIGVGYRF